MKKRAVVLLSGGLDSTTCLAVSKEEYGEIVALNMYYGQRHDKEIECARKIADFYNVEQYIELDVSNVMQFSNCAMLKNSTQEIKHSTYEEQKEEGGVNTYVPFRNGLFLSMAASIAESISADAVVYGAHKDDVAGDAYPDCSEKFVEAMRAAIEEGTGGRVTLDAPFVNKTKAEIVAAGLKRDVPYKFTWSCYEGGDKPCGKCATCLDREEAFKINGKEDPLWSD